MHKHINEYVQYLMMACVVCGSATLNTETEREIVVWNDIHTVCHTVCVFFLKIRFSTCWKAGMSSCCHIATVRLTVEHLTFPPPFSSPALTLHPVSDGQLSAPIRRIISLPLGSTSDIRRAPVAGQAWSTVWPTCINTPNICLVVRILFLSVCVLSFRFYSTSLMEKSCPLLCVWLLRSKKCEVYIET